MNRSLVALLIGTTTLLNGNALQASINNTSQYTITTLAGNVGVEGNSNGNSTNASFNGPDGIAVDGHGILFVVDSGNDTIRKIDTNGNVTTIAGQSGVQGSSDGKGTSALFNGPGGIAVDGHGNLFVADVNNNTIRKIDTNGNVTTIAGQAGVLGSSDGKGTSASFSYPYDTAVDSKGNLFVVDSGNDTIRKIDTNGNVTTIAGQAGIQGSSDGNGSKATFYLPNGIAVDGHGNLFVADNYNATIRKIDTNGNVTTIAGQAGVLGSSDGDSTKATFYNPLGIAVDGTGNLFVTDAQGDNTIRKIDTFGNVTTLAGQAGVDGNSNGIGTNALFNDPTGIAVDGHGNFYVADLFNNLIRKGVPEPAISQTIKFGAIPKKIYGTAAFNLTATTTSGLPVSFTSSNTNVATVSGNTVSIVGAGLTTITANQTGGGSYKPATPVNQILTVGRASQTITFSKIPLQVLGASSLSLTASSPSRSPVTFTSSNKKVATISDNAVTLVGAGVTTITATVPISANYNAATAHQVLTVTKPKSTN